MRPLGKTMKIAHAVGTNENDALKMLLNNYRNTPHSSTGISPSSMLFRDGERSIFPRQSATDCDVQSARARDLEQKKTAQSKVNAGKFRISSEFMVGDQVLVRNYQKTSKFDPTFLPDPYVVLEISENGQCLTIESVINGGTLRRHPDDVKKFHGPTPQLHNGNQAPSEREVLKEYMGRLSQVFHDYEDTFGSTPIELQHPTRPQRTRQNNPRNNPRYYNDEFVNVMDMVR